MKIGKFHIVFWREGKFWVAKCIENSIVSQGLSFDEAQENIKKALELTAKDDDSNYSEISDVRMETLEIA